MSGSEERNSYSGSTRVAQPAIRHGSGGNEMYGSDPAGSAFPPDSGRHRSPPSGRRPRPWNSAGRLRRISVPSIAWIERSSISGIMRTRTGAWLVNGLRFARSTSASR